MARKAISFATQVDILVASGRRCALCWNLKGDFDMKRGQICHINQDNSNNTFDNLVFLCLECHDTYDSRTSQSKGILPDELTRYREMLYDFVKELRNSWHRQIILAQREESNQIVEN